jgi:hypothetical protein
MITADVWFRGVHPKSEILDQAGAAPRRLIIEWATQV